MLEIKENQELNVVNVFSFRGKVQQMELENIGKEMEEYIQNAGSKRIGNSITATYAVDGEFVDVELIIPIDKSIESTEKFSYKKCIKITNAVIGCYKGNPSGFQEAYKQLNTYIIDQKLQPITVGYNVTKRMDILNPDNTEIDIYVGINPNIL